jgi:hypothetical protein
VAEACQLLTQHIVADFIPRREEYDEGPVFMAALEAEQLGLINGATGLGGLTKVFTLTPHGTAMIQGRKHGLLLQGPPGTKVEVSAAVLTSTGRQVFSLLELGDERARLRAVAPNVQTPGIQRLTLGGLRTQQGKLQWVPLEVVWEQPGGG